MLIDINWNRKIEEVEPLNLEREQPKEKEKKEAPKTRARKTTAKKSEKDE